MQAHFWTATTWVTAALALGTIGTAALEGTNFDSQVWEQVATNTGKPLAVSQTEQQAANEGWHDHQLLGKGVNRPAQAPVKRSLGLGSTPRI